MQRSALVISLALALSPAAALAQASGEQQTRLGALLGSSEGQVRTVLGEPDVARREDGGAMWTYRLPACALFVYFRNTGREGLRVVGASSGPRRRGEAAPAAESCLAAAVK